VNVAAKRQLKKITTLKLFIGGRVSKHCTPSVPESRAFSIAAPHWKSNALVTFVDLPNQGAANGKMMWSSITMTLAT
jgi:hypothetical protein